jgi:transcriptional regulator
MYIPEVNRETRPGVLRGLIDSHPLASLVTLNSGGLFATHLPLLLDAEEGTHGVLRGHLSRANTQWKDFDSSVEALAIFSGAEHYITPSWYPEKAVDGKVVPTWNYAVVHAYGVLKVIEDSAWLLGHLNELTRRHEAGFAAPWQVGDAPADFIATMMKGIVGIELPISRLEGKWKVSQNKSAATLASVEHGLEELDTPQSLAMRDLVCGRRP